MKLIKIIFESILIGLIALAMTSIAQAQRPKRSATITPPPPPPNNTQSTSPR
jgi:hypothetical protein